jgi:hypothetical protein
MTVNPGENRLISDTLIVLISRLLLFLLPLGSDTLSRGENCTEDVREANQINR